MTTTNSESNPTIFPPADLLHPPNFCIQNLFFKTQAVLLQLKVFLFLGEEKKKRKKKAQLLSPIKYCFINLKTVINYISAFWLQANIHNSFSLSSQSASNLLIIFLALLPSSVERKEKKKPYIEANHPQHFTDAPTLRKTRYTQACARTYTRVCVCVYINRILK